MKVVLFPHLSALVTCFCYFAMKFTITAFTHSPYPCMLIVESNVKSFPRQLQRGTGNPAVGATRRLAHGRR
jgi:hypothetical protein